MFATFNPRRDEYFTTLAKVWSSDRRQSIAKKLETEYMLSDSEGTPQPFNLKENPYWRKPIDLCNSASTRKITILKSTQVGGTLASQGILAAMAIIDPSPAMILFPNLKEAILQRDRMYGNFATSSPDFRKLVPPQHLWNTRTINLLTQDAYIAIAKSDQTMRGKPVRWLFKNETDVCLGASDAGFPPEVVNERTKRFKNTCLIFQESTPVGDESFIASEFESSQRNHWYFPCPKCGKYQKARFFPFKEGDLKGKGGIAGYRDENGNLRTEAEARRHAHYVCIKGCKITPEYKNLMIQRGKWVPDGCRIDREGNITGTPLVGDRHVGFHIWTMMQHMISIGDIAATYVEFSKKGTIRQFFQDWLGIKYVSNRQIPTWKKLGEKYTTDSYRLKEVPDDVWFLTAGNDVQEHELYTIVWGWSPFQSPALIDLRIFDLEHYQSAYQFYKNQLFPTDFVQLAHLLDLDKTLYPVAGSGKNPLGLSKLGIKKAGIDQNYSERMQDVHSLVSLFKDPNDPRKDRLVATRGDNKVKNNIRYRMNEVERSARDGKVYEGGMRLWGLNKDFYRDIWDTRFTLDPGTPQAMRLPSNFSESPHYERCLQQFVNERKTLGYDKNKYEKKEYRISNKQLRVDFRDASMIAEAVADMTVDLIFGTVTWNKTEWERFLAKQRAIAERQKQLKEERSKMAASNVSVRTQIVDDVIRR